MENMNLDDVYFVGETSFGRVIIEFISLKNPPVITSVATNNLGQLQRQITDNAKSITYLYDHIKDLYKRIDQEDTFYFYVDDKYMPSPDTISVSGWQINGQFFYENKPGVNTVKELLKYLMSEAEGDVFKLSRFNQVVIVELIEKYLPEVIVEFPNNFERLKFNDKIHKIF